MRKYLTDSSLSIDLSADSAHAAHQRVKELLVAALQTMQVRGEITAFSLEDERIDVEEYRKDLEWWPGYVPEKEGAHD